MVSKWPKLRLRLRTLMAIIALIAAGLWAWSTFLDPIGRQIRLLGSDRPAYVRREAAFALGSVIAPSRVDEAVTVLIGALKDPSPRVRESAIAGLFAHGKLANRAVPRVISLLKDEDGNVRYSAAAVLGTITATTGPERSEAIAGLLGASGDKRSNVRIAIAESLLQFGEAKRAATVLAELSSDPDPRLRREVLFMISRWAGPNDRSLVPVLLKASCDEDMGNRLEAAKLLVTFGRPEAAIPILIEAERYGEKPFRDRASQIRDKIGPVEIDDGMSGKPR